MAWVARQFLQPLASVDDAWLPEKSPFRQRGVRSDRRAGDSRGIRRAYPRRKTSSVQTASVAIRQASPVDDLAEAIFLYLTTVEA